MSAGPLPARGPILFLSFLLFAGLAFCRVNAQPNRGMNTRPQPPRIFFTDLDSGPAAGGERFGKFSGAYVTLFGNFFGTTQKSSTVTWKGQHCLRIVPAVGSYAGWGAPYLWYQKIVVQIGAACREGPGEFVVTVNGQPSNGIPFTIRPGRIFCVSSAGSDRNSGTFLRGCWATLVRARKQMAPGDITYVGDGVAALTLDDYDANLAITTSGVAGRPIALVACPGARVTIGTAMGKVGYALRTPNIGGFHYWTLAGLTVRSANIGLEVSGGSSDFRAIAIDASCPMAIGAFQGGCLDTALGASRMTFLGNYSHDNAQVSPRGSTKGFHNLYFSTDSNHVTAAWNLIDGDSGRRLCNGGPCNACRGIQFHSSPALGGGPKDHSGHGQFDLHVHDNVIRNTHCDGINFATVDPSRGPVEAYNNVIYHTGTGVLTGDQSSYACICFAGILNNGPAPGGAARVYNNTCYDFGGGGGPNAGAIAASPSGALKVDLRNNIFAALPGQSYVSGSAQRHSAMFMGNANLFFGAGAGPRPLASGPRTDPGFANAKAGDFRLLPGSAAIDSGANTALGTDIDGVRRPQGSRIDIGAYEFAGSR